MPDTIRPDLNEIASSLFRVSAKLLIIQDGKLLVTREAEGWCGLPGGGVDHGEAIAAGLVREIEEELGCVIDPETIASVPSLIDTTAVFNGIPRCTLVYQRTQSPTVAPARQELDFSWVTPEEFSQLDLAPNITPLREQILGLV